MARKLQSCSTLNYISLELHYCLIVSLLVFLFTKRSNVGFRTNALTTDTGEFT